MTRANPYEMAAATLLRESGCTVRKWRTNNSGTAYCTSADWGIEVPHPRGPISFAVFAHEIGHQLLHRFGRRPRYREEVEAWEYALAQFERFGLDSNDVTRRATRSIAYAFLKARRRSPRLATVIPGEFPEWHARIEAAAAELSQQKEAG